LELPPDAGNSKCAESPDGLRDLKAGLARTRSCRNQKVNNTHRFEIAPFAKKCLLEGLDEIDFTLSQAGRIANFEKSYQP
jgi:3-isopropylmalate dehydratase small subunit